LQSLLDAFGSDGYAWLVIWEHDWSQNEDYFNTNNLSPTNDCSDPSWSVLSAYTNKFGTGSGAIPQAYLLDRDGYVRKYGLGALDDEPHATEWTNAVRELLGLPTS